MHARNTIFKWLLSPDVFKSLLVTLHDDFVKAEPAGLKNSSLVKHLQCTTDERRSQI